MENCNLDKKLCDIIGFKLKEPSYAVTSFADIHCTYSQKLQLCFLDTIVY